MKTVILKSITVGDKQFTAPANEYSTIAEMIADAGGEEKLVAKVNGFLHAHGTLGDVRSELTDIVQELTKVKFLTITKSVVKDGKTSTVEVRDNAKDSDAKYIPRALALVPTVTFDQVQTELTRRAKGYSIKDETGATVEIPPFAASCKPRAVTERKPKALPANFRDVAVNMVNDPAKLTKFQAALKKLGMEPFTPVGELNTEANIVALGWLAKAWSVAVAEAAKKSAGF